jgi:hypothetical protein
MSNDELADRFLPGGTRALVRLARWEPVRRWIFRVTENRIPRLWARLCRKRYIDDQVLQATQAGIEAVVILGAGMDTRAYRIAALADLPVYEADLPANIERKRRRLNELYGAVPQHVHLVALDFETHSLAEVLGAAGYTPGSRTLFGFRGWSCARRPYTGPPLLISVPRRSPWRSRGRGRRGACLRRLGGRPRRGAGGGRVRSRAVPRRRQRRRCFRCWTGLLWLVR